MFNYNSLHLAEPKRIYLSRPNHHKIGQLAGITSAKLYVYLQDIWKIDLSVDKYIDGKLNKFYDSLNPMMELYVPDIGWFRIDAPPDENQENDRICKTLTARGIETQLNDIDITLYHINCADEISYEMFEENINAQKIPERNIRFYIKNESDDPASENYWKLGALNIIEHEYLRPRGWAIGTIGSTGSTLSSKSGRRFEIASSTCYDILTNDMSAAYECIFVFDRENKQINAYDIEEIGKSLNIECSFRNLINSVDITPQENDIYTELNVAGANDDTMIEYVNFGSSKIFDLSYMIASSGFPPEFIDKYDRWTNFRESKRHEYADIIKQYLDYENQIKFITTQMPDNIVNQKWNVYSLDELKAELSKFQKMQEHLEKVNTVDDILQIEKSHNYALYLSIKDVIIPDIQTELHRQETAADAEPSKVDYTTMWPLYGIEGLKNRRIECQSKAAVLKKAGYDQPWSQTSDTKVTETAHNRNYNDYQTNMQYISEIDARLAILNDKVADFRSQIDTLDDSRRQLIDDVSVSNETFRFTPQEIETIRLLLKGSDYKDTSIQVTDPYNINDVISSAWDLFNSASEELHIRCRPQYTFSVSLDNLYHIDQFKEKAAQIEVGDFMYLELDGGVKTKQRIIGMDLELIDFNDHHLHFEFSDAVNACGKANDYRFLLGNSTGFSKNSISRETKAYIKDSVISAADSVFNQYFGNNGSGLFSNGIAAADAVKLSDALSGLVGGNLTVSELKAKLAQIDTLEADAAFTKYLETRFLVGNQADFKSLQARLAQIDNLLSGTVSAELGHILELTAQNVHIDEAVIKDIIAAQIMVSDLKAGTINTKKMNISSDNGKLTIIDNTMQFRDEQNNVRIQMGLDAAGNYTFAIYDATGSGKLFDENGIHDSAIGNGLIKNDMLAGGITKDKINWSDAGFSTDENGNVTVNSAQVIIDNESLSSKFNTLSTSVDHHTEMLNTHSTSIQQHSDSIESLISHTTITKEDGSTVSIKDQLNQTISDVNGTKTKISALETNFGNIKIGAVNLADCSGNYSPDSKITWTKLSGNDWDITPGSNVLKITKLTDNADAWILIPLGQALTEKESYVITANLRTGAPKSFCIYAVVSEGDGITQSEVICEINALDTMKKYSGVHEIIGDGYSFLALKGSEFNTNDFIEFKNIMFEHGTIASDWCESGNDYALKLGSEISKVNASIQDVSGNYSILSEQIAHCVTADDLSGYVKSEDLQEELENAVNHLDTTYVSENKLQETVNSINSSIQMAGGYNMIKNSIGLGLTKENRLTGWTYINPENIKVYSVQGTSFAIYGGESEIVMESLQADGGYIYQDISTMPNMNYTIALHLNPDTDTDFNLKISDTLSDSVIHDNLCNESDITVNNYNYITKSFTAQSNITRIIFEVRQAAKIHIAGLRLVIGSNPLQWTLSSGESYSANVRMDVEGITVYGRNDPNSFTRMSPEEFAGYSSHEKIFWVSEDEFHMKKAVIEDAVVLGNILMQTVDTPSLPANKRGVLFVSQNKGGH